MTILEWGVAALVVAGVLYWLGIFPRVQVILAFIGTCIVTGGVFGRIVTWVAIRLDTLTNAAVGKVFGVAVPGLLVVILVIIFIYDLHPKGGGTGRRTLWVGIILAACLVAGLSSFQTLNNVPSGVRTGVGNASTITGRQLWKSSRSSSSSWPSGQPSATPGRAGASPARRT